MKFENTLEFRLKSPDGDAVFTCRGLNRKLGAKIRAEMRNKNENFLSDSYDELVDAALSSVILVLGLHDETGAPITAEQIRSGDIADKLAGLITTGYIAALGANRDEPQEKKDSNLGSSSDTNTSNQTQT